MPASDYAGWFRGSTPYISAHRNKTFVVLLSGEALAHANVGNIVHDLALLHVLGVRLLLVHGARPQIDAALADRGVTVSNEYHLGRRVTDETTMQAVTAVCGELRSDLEAGFSNGLPNTPLHNVDIAVIGGNFVTAKPIGVRDGVDHLFTGAVRKIEVTQLTQLLDHGYLPLLSPLGYSPSGQVFNLAADELASDLAIAVGADKLVMFDAQPYFTGPGSERISSATPTQLEQYCEQNAIDSRRYQPLARAVRGGVRKAHLVSYQDDGALLGELFTAQGVGSQILEQPSETIRPAHIDDVSAIVELIRPLEEQGILVRRERNRLEREIEHFIVAEIDQVVVGCCAIYPYEKQAELACVAVHEHYRKLPQPSLGNQLLAAAETRARDLHAEALFVLTTQSRDWFLENGFNDAEPEWLPAQKQSFYNWQRNSKVLTKPVAPAT